MTAFWRAVDRLIEAGAILAALQLAFVTIGVSLDVFLRGTDITALPWMIDVSEWMLYGIAFLGAPWVLREQGHISVDIVLQTVTPVVRLWLTRLADTIGLGCSIFLTVWGARVFYDVWANNRDIFKNVVLPEWVLFWAIPVAGLLLSLQFVRQILHGRPRGDAAHHEL